MMHRPAGFWKRWIARFCWVQLQIVLSGVFLLGGEMKSFNLAGLKLLPTPWDRAANFAKLEHHAHWSSKDRRGQKTASNLRSWSYTGG